MRKFFAVVAAATPLLAGIGIAIAFASKKGSRRRLGAVDPWADTGDVEINSDEYKIAPGDYSDEDNPTRPTRDEPGYEGGCLILGRHHRKLLSDPYRVCLTANQEKKLFQGKRLKMRKLGCGTFACAYESPAKSRVVKFTRDSEDVAALLKAQPTKLVPKVFAVYKLAQNGRTAPVRDSITQQKAEPRSVPVYALVLERLRTLPPHEMDLVNEELIRIYDAKVGEKISGNDFCDAQVDEDGNTGCSDVQMGVINAIEKLRKLGIKWTDTHAGNIGYDRNGKLKVLDLGVSQTKLEKEPEVLEGILRAARAKLGNVPSV